MRRDSAGYADLAVTAAVTVTAALVILLTAQPRVAGLPWMAGLPWVAGLPLALALPGYALSTLLVPAAPRGQMNPALWRGLWTVGLSLALAALGGLLLNLTPAGLTRTTWTVSLTAVTLLTLAASAWLRSLRSGGTSASWVTTERPPARAALTVLAALAVAGVAIGLAVVSAGWQRSPGFAQLWLVPSRIVAARGPAAPGQATLGVRSGYAGTETFHLVLRRDTSTIGTWDFTLTAGQTWQRAITTQAGQHLTAQLSTTGQPSAAQTVGIG